MSTSDDRPVVIATEDPTSPDAQRCMQAYFAALEARAREHGAMSARLETNRSLTEAIRLYRSAGYQEVPAFNEEPYAHHWFEKDLTDS